MNKYKIASIMFLTIFALTLFPVSVHADDARFPVVTLSSYEIEGEVYNNTDFTLAFTMKNESSSSAAYNLAVSYTSAGNAFYPSSGTSNQHYIPQIDAGSTYTATFQLSSNPNIEVGAYNIYFSYKYQNDANENISMEAIISVHVSDENLLEISDISIPAECMANKRSFMSIKYGNPGNMEIRNVKIVIEGNILEEEKEVSVPNMKPQSVNFADANITFLETGKQTLKIILSYEDLEGNISRSQTQLVTTDVFAQATHTSTVSSETSPLSSEEPLGIMSRIFEGEAITPAVLVAAAVILLVVIGIIVIRIRKHG